MKLSVAFTIVIRMFLGLAIAFPTHHIERHIPYGMDDFYPFIARNSSDVLPLSKNLTQIQRLRWADKCVQFRKKCTLAEHCCSLRCLKRFYRCIT
ncbi:uncharacterized protein LOC26535435 [Drosophila yakuba]|uniref:Uncharacterized protein n=1 Tax=Drosophila yakuba TaxID=7245 RepID=A0A0R1E1L2_DROYA|nr:uncharacterized protein LOC26535435 [Drosophila yakuba]XP_039491885.1 uncharacterized protein LOC120451930 [Drosophila santomea]KRK03163.1 uncharacterized protein Dyak_GE28254 [Drosophila yakuba]